MVAIPKMGLTIAKRLFEQRDSKKTSPQITQINAETGVNVADYQESNPCKSAKICG